MLEKPTLIVEKKWLWNNAFRSTRLVNGQECMVVIDGGSSSNNASQAPMDSLQLRVHKHPQPYFVWWLMTKEEVQLRERCQVTFIFYDDYKDKVWCNVVLMDAGYVLLVRPWMHEKHGIHQMRENTYTFIKDDKVITLYPMKQEPPKNIWG